LIRAVLLDFGETLVERVSDQVAPLSRLELKPFPDSVPALDRLRRAGYRLAMVSNTEQSSEEEMERALGTVEMRGYFDVIVTSYSFGVRKPDAAIFARALKRLGCGPEEAVMVGDDVMTDLSGAAALGMATILVRRTPREPEPADVSVGFTVSSLLDVPAILARLAAVEGA
jgi:putative hydrolase of the HAD superfamily